MNELQGSIIIDTEIDTSGFERDTKKVRRALESLSSRMTGLGGVFQRAMSGSASAAQQFDVRAQALEKTIQGIKKSMQDLGSARIRTEDYAFVVEQIRQTEKELERYEKRKEQLENRGTSTESTAWQNVMSDIAAARKRLAEYEREQARMKANGEAFTMGVDTAEYRELSAALSESTQELVQMRQELAQYQVQQSAAGDQTQRTTGDIREQSSAARAAQTGASGLGRALRNISGGRRGLAAIAKDLLGIGRNARSAEGSLAKLVRRFTRFSGQLASRIRGAFISGIVNGVRQALDSLAQYSGTVNESLSSMKSALTQLRNSLATAFAPILTAVVPALVTLINHISAAVTWVARLIATLTGQNTFIRAVAVQEDYAAALGSSAGAAKKLRRVLASFDSLNILSSDSGSGGGGGEAGALSPSEMFEEVEIGENDFAKKLKEAWEKADLTEIGEIIGGKLRDALGSISWESIQQKAGEMATRLATLLNGIFSADGLFSEIGNTVAEAVNTLFSTLKRLIDEVNWRDAGAAIIDTLGGLFDGLDFSQIGASIAGFVGSLVELLAGAVERVEWETLPKRIVQKIGNFFEGAGDRGLAAKISSFMGTAVGAAVKFLDGAAKTLWEGFVDKVNKTADRYRAAYEKAGGNIFKAFWEVLKEEFLNIDEWIQKNIIEPFAEALGRMLGIEFPTSLSEKKITVALEKDKKFDTTKKEYDEIKPKNVEAKVGANPTQNFRNIQKDYDELKPKGVIVQVGANPTPNLRKIQKDYDDLRPKGAVVTLGAEKAPGFDKNVEQYNAVQSGKVTKTVEVKIATAGLTPAEKRAAGLLASGGIITPAGNIRAFAGGGKISAGGRANWWDSVRKYASGASRAAGSLFVAGEAGPELVAHVNGHSEVLNKSQISQAIYGATLAANLKALSSIEFRMPAAASGLMPYEVAARIESKLDSIQETLVDTNEEIIQVIISAISSQTASLVSALSRSSGPVGTDGLRLRDVVAQINRQTVSRNSSPLLA